ncbi:MAG: hypothetical protein HF982_00160 [Desulfobacteraceae bacterium]|nr:hypothetical protein [Desulfobacteraceae bacterium]MBC2718017.1 hypothetical protein [Desulfobacteraceae bacterium]
MAIFKADFMLILRNSTGICCTIFHDEATSSACKEPFFNIAVNGVANLKNMS